MAGDFVCPLCPCDLRDHDDYGFGACRQCSCKGEGHRGDPLLIEQLVKEGRLPRPRDS